MTLRLGWAQLQGYKHLVAAALLAVLLGLPLAAQNGGTLPAAESTSNSQKADPLLHEALHLPTPQNAALPTLWLVGDSTVRNGHGDGANGQWGWGDLLGPYFDPAKINVVNRAIGGRSSRTYISEGHWKEVLAMAKRGDFLLVQFGHNDSGPLDDTARARGTLPGVGDESREIDNPILKRHEVVHTFGWYMKEYVGQARERGITVILCTLIPRKIWKDGHIVRSGPDSFGGWTRETALAEHVPVLDLNEIISREYDSLGTAAVEPLFGDPHTHTSLEGAKLNARAVISGLKLLHPDPLAKFFSPFAAEVPGSMPVSAGPNADRE